MTNKKQGKNNGNHRERSTNGKGRLPQETETDKQYKDLNYRFRAYSNTSDGKLITYLQQGNGLSTTKEMILQALRMCWLPLAYKAQADAGISEQEVRRIGLTCCHALEQHLAYLRMELRLPLKSSDALPIPLSTMTNPQTLAAMFGLDVGNSSDEDTTNKNQDSTNSNSGSGSESQIIDSDSFIPGKGSFHDDDDDMFADI
ncbi:hypothetical protein A0J48_013280 [Sphaerospermopsis aphanizomenoides BCCUSP55]|uniref:hypothetical protein n=1 Tax=Sphaerospermopsis aphanizomenoides TaxID=459663 RepID=UPI001904C7D0|nr:hypothetical protein [Sphaerospermopsis aphanizomenoides]MBK1988499.1 hypothetical protein [Sphaerospermopsis aphanizomenoides BCCUSP55]